MTGTGPTRSPRASSATSSVNTTRTATTPCTTRWCAWRRTSRCATCWWTARATSARWTATRRPPCVTPKCACRASPASCWRTSRRKPSISRPNYDGSETEPTVMPARFPNLLVNGSAGIAVGMATNIPPHNLTEIINACLAVLDNPEVMLAELMQHVPGPDFPTAGIINGATEIATAYRTGRGRLSIRARTQLRGHGQGWPPGHHRHRAAVPGEQGAPASSASPSWSATRRSKASPMPARRVRQGRHAHRHRAQAR